MESTEEERRRSSLNVDIPENANMEKRQSLRSVDLDSDEHLNIKVTSFDNSHEHSSPPVDQSVLEGEQQYLNWVDSKSGRHLSSPSTMPGKSNKQATVDHSSKDGAIPSTESLSVVATPPPYPSGSDPVKVVCPKCGEFVETVVLQMPSAKAIMICSILMLLLLWCFCWIPLCMKSCKEDVHMCPKCKVVYKYDKKYKGKTKNKEKKQKQYKKEKKKNSSS